MNALTLEVILRVVFGVTDEARLARLRPLVNDTVDVKPAVLLGWGYPFLQRFGPWKKVVENQRALDEVLYAEIAERRAAADLAERTDVLSRLLQVATTRARRRCPTPSCATSWSRCCWPVTRRPRPRCRGRSTSWAATRTCWRGLAGGRDAGDDDYLEAVMKESMRLHPIIPMVVRLLMAPATIGGSRPAPRAPRSGRRSSSATRAEDNHREPDAFRPERFLDGRGGHRTPGSRSAAVSAAASVPASRSWRASRCCARC